MSALQIEEIIIKIMNIYCHGRQTSYQNMHSMISVSYYKFTDLNCKHSIRLPIEKIYSSNLEMCCQNLVQLLRSFLQLDDLTSAYHLYSFCWPVIISVKEVLCPTHCKSLQVFHCHSQILKSRVFYLFGKFSFT